MKLTTQVCIFLAQQCIVSKVCMFQLLESFSLKPTLGAYKPITIRARGTKRKYKRGYLDMIRNKKKPRCIEVLIQTQN